MFDAFIADASERYNVPVPWIQAVIQKESSWNADAFNPDDPGGARGLMQITAPTARALGVTDLGRLFDPAYNIDRGTDLLGQLRRAYGDNFQRVYSAYNSGKPDLYKTSSEVGANVAKALEYLEDFARESVETLTTASTATGGIALLVLFVLMWGWGKRR